MFPFQGHHINEHTILSLTCRVCQVKVDTWLNTGDAAPRIHELTMFRQGKRTESDNEDDNSDDDTVVGKVGILTCLDMH